MQQTYPYSTRPAGSSTGSSGSRQTPQRRRQTKKVSSRLAKTEQQKIAQQTMLIVVAAVLLLLVFIFVILPGVIRLAGNVSEGNFGLDESDTIPPQTPIVSAPPEAVTEQRIEISGFGEPESMIKIIVNDTPTAETMVDDEGSFVIEVPLQEGPNQIRAYAIDAAQNESSVTRNYQVVSDNQPPTIELASPTDGQEFVSKQYETITIDGQTEPGAYIFINGRRYRADSKEGMFSARLRLEEGDNTISLRAEDLAGNFTEQEIKVSYRE